MNNSVLAPMVRYINWTGVPDSFKGRCSAVCRSLSECEGLVAWFEHPDFAPFQPVMLLVPGALPIAIQGHGYASAAELRDCAVVTWERTLEKLAKHGTTLFDIDEAREKAGLADRDKADALIREALWERAQKHKATPVTDPGRQPVYPNPTNKVSFSQHPGVPYEVTSD